MVLSLSLVVVLILFCRKEMYVKIVDYFIELIFIIYLNDIFRGNIILYWYLYEYIILDMNIWIDDGKNIF